jgi:hypothetical protein
VGWGEDRKPLAHPGRHQKEETQVRARIAGGTGSRGQERGAGPDAEKEGKLWEPKE